MNKSKKKKQWHEYLYVVSTIYLLLGIFNILFAWLGIICFSIPLIISLKGEGKAYCKSYCGRGQLLFILGNKLKLSRNKPMPKFLRTKWFRYGFLAFFMTMFGSMLFNTYMVFAGTRGLRQVITVLWTWKLPWDWVNTSFVSQWAASFAFGFYSIMLTSTILGVIMMGLFKSRSWCVVCPMGTMTQGISIIKHKNAA
ncbi:MAG: 4Fe-4S binding protein [Clostridiaceae bacterium]